MHIHKLGTFINDEYYKHVYWNIYIVEQYENVINMFHLCMMGKYINIVHMVLRHYIKDYLRTFINEYHLGYITAYEHVFHEITCI